MPETIALRYHKSNSGPLVPLESDLLCNVGMEVRDIRRRNMEVLAAELGTLKALADMVGTSALLLSQIRNKTRNMGHTLARQFEDAFKKPVGWMDQLQGINSGPAPFSLVMGSKSDSESKASPDKLRRAYRLVDRAVYETKTPLTPQQKESMVNIVVELLDTKSEIGTVKALLRVIK